MLQRGELISQIGLNSTNISSNIIRIRTVLVFPQTPPTIAVAPTPWGTGAP